MRNYLVRFIVPPLLLAFLIVGSQSASSRALHQTAAAQPRGPLSLAVDAADGSLLKAHNGVSRSTDHGRTWWALPIPVAGVLWATSRRAAETANVGGIPGPIGAPDSAQDVGTLVGKPAPGFTLADSEGKSYTVTPGQGRPTVLIFHMGIT